MPLSQSALLAANICTAPLRVDAWPPLLANVAGTLRTAGLLGSMDRIDPSCPTPVSSGAPKFDWLPTRIRFGSATAPGTMYEAKWVGIGLPPHAPWLASRNVPTCEMADAPGISTATTRARLQYQLTAEPSSAAAVVPLAAINPAPASSMQTCFIVCPCNLRRCKYRLLPSADLRQNHLQIERAARPKALGEG